MISNSLTEFAARFGATLLPDNQQWTHRFEIRSESSSRMYIVAQNKANGRFACSCMGWKRHRHCKHLDNLRPILAEVERLKP